MDSKNQRACALLAALNHTSVAQQAGFDYYVLSGSTNLLNLLTFDIHRQIQNELLRVGLMLSNRGADHDEDAACHRWQMTDDHTDPLHRAVHLQRHALISANRATWVFFALLRRLLQLCCTVLAGAVVNPKFRLAHMQESKFGGPLAADKARHAAHRLALGVSC